MAIKKYVEGHERRGITLLVNAVANRIVDEHRASFILKDTKEELLAYGIEPEDNDYVNLTLKEYIAKSFNINQSSCFTKRMPQAGPLLIRNHNLCRAYSSC